MKRDISYSSEKWYCGRRLSRRAAMYIMCLFSVLFAVAVIFTLLLFIGGRAVAEGTLNRAQFQIQQLQFGSHQLKGTGQEHIKAWMDVTVVNNYPLDAKLQKGRLQLMAEGRAFGEVILPEMHWKASAFNHKPLSLTLIITHNATFLSFMETLFQQDSVALEMQGKVAVGSQMFPVFDGLHLSKSIPLVGLKSFSLLAPRVVDQYFVSTEEGLAVRSSVKPKKVFAEDFG